MFENLKAMWAERKERKVYEKCQKLIALDHALEDAVNADDKTAVKKLLKKGADPNTLVDIGGPYMTFYAPLYNFAKSEEVKKLFRSYGYLEKR